mmetsp:Transcript_24714/g.28163  ORF Transcript_24714/g.28163 Transcript_24714/m.28163 type:complete len:453 (-) Transcript_24714:123-1481(-)
MMQIKLFAILLLFLCDVCALKGPRFGSRALEDDTKRGKKDDKEIDGENSPSTKKEGSGSKKDKSEKDKSQKQQSKKDGKKGTAGKKCKKDALNNNSESESDESDSGDSEDDSQETELVQCTDIKFNANCAALRSAETPVVPDDADGMVEGTIIVEMTSENGDTIAKMNKALKEIALTSVGCDGSSSERMLQDGNDESASLNGIEVTGLEETDDDCYFAKGGCDTYESPMTIYYSGNPTEEQMNSIASKISSAVIADSEEGEYDDIAEVHYVEAFVGEYTSSQKSKEKTGGIIGGVVGALALLAAGGAGYMYSKRRRGAPVNPTTEVNSKEKGLSGVESKDKDHPFDEASKGSTSKDEGGELVVNAVPSEKNVIATHQSNNEHTFVPATIVQQEDVEQPRNMANEETIVAGSEAQTKDNASGKSSDQIVSKNDDGLNLFACGLLPNLKANFCG